jgi:hypothetical protein
MTVTMKPTYAFCLIFFSSVSVLSALSISAPASNKTQANA